MNNYIQLAIRTESPFFEVESTRLLHAVIGVSTETAEAMLAAYNEDRVNLAEELGDLLWYVAIACSELQVTFEELHSLTRPVEDQLKALVEASSGALDLVKKSLFYGKPLNTVAIGEHLGTVVEVVRQVAEEELSLSLADLQHQNIRKLQTRYPEKFTVADAEARVDQPIS